MEYPYAENRTTTQHNTTHNTTTRTQQHKHKQFFYFTQRRTYRGVRMIFFLGHAGASRRGTLPLSPANSCFLFLCCETEARGMNAKSPENSRKKIAQHNEKKKQGHDDNCRRIIRKQHLRQRQHPDNPLRIILLTHSESSGRHHSHSVVPK